MRSLCCPAIVTQVDPYLRSVHDGRDRDLSCASNELQGFPMRGKRKRTWLHAAHTWSSNALGYHILTKL